MTHRSDHGLTPEPGRAWLKQAACRGKGDVMFPENVVSELDRARRICTPCAVREECLADAMAAEGDASAKNRYGIRAGLTGGQRRHLYEALRKKQATRLKEAAA